MTVVKIRKEITVIQVITNGDTNDVQYIANTSGYGSARLANYPADAKDLSKLPIKDQIDFLISSERAMSDLYKYHLSIVKSVVEIENTPIDMDDPEIKEILQKLAFDKLTRSQIEAMGCTDILMYHKLKFHNNKNGSDSGE